MLISSQGRFGSCDGSAWPLALRLFATERALAWIYDYHVPWDDRREAA